jgi:hypothetical protein
MSEKSSEIHWFDEGGKRPEPVRPTPPPGPSPISPDNRRKHARFQVASTQVSLHRLGILTALNLASNKARKVCDLSKGGARILVTEKLGISQKVRVKITLEKYQDQIEIGGEVKWCFPSTNRKDFFVGIEFNPENPAVARKMSALQEWFTSPQYQALRSRR